MGSPSRVLRMALRGIDTSGLMGCSATCPQNTLDADLNGSFMETLAFKPNMILSSPEPGLRSSNWDSEPGLFLALARLQEGIRICYQRRRRRRSQAGPQRPAPSAPAARSAHRRPAAELASRRLTCNRLVQTLAESPCGRVWSRVRQGPNQTPSS
ncbi:Suppressor Of Ikbke 1 [Manis pentadactyla]|nr:Suppressor Of Ikbke 1 [Manis pentadactyla]